MQFPLIELVDGYKLDHRRQYPNNTQNVYSNWTARSSRIPGVEKVVFLGLQYIQQEYFINNANETFFGGNRGKILTKYQKRLDGYFGPNDIGVGHIADLYDLGYIPLEFRAIPEGTHVPLKVPMFTVESTHDHFAWVTNYFESFLSSNLWRACTSATNAYRMRLLLERHAKASGDLAMVDWQAHDFSFRGMGGVEDAAMSGAGHLLSFTGTDSLPALELLEQYYYGDNEPLLGMSVPATEHSVMCAGGEKDEIDTYARLLDLYPNGILSIVSDTWDLWAVIRDILPALKIKIMARNGKLVIRPDSGDPTLILCGDPSHEGDTIRDSMIRKGVIECLWELFGGTVNEHGHKVLDSHIGAIYGDSINFERADEICTILRRKGFASTNVVFGLGSYFYVYVTRDTFGFAMKATAAKVAGVEHKLFKDPKTDSGVKRSARGRLVVLQENGNLVMKDGLTLAEQQAYGDRDQLKLTWRNGVFYKKYNVGQMRYNIRTSY